MPKTVLITGSSSGIGRATAELFASRGWNVAATVRKSESLIAPTTATNVMKLPLDVSNEAMIAPTLTAILQRFGTIDVLVNNAGYGLFGPLEVITPEQLQAQFQTNVFGVASMMRHVLPIMRRQRSGTIVNISSMAGRMAMPFASAYHATKYAIEGLSESLRFELGLHGIWVKLVEPGHVKTDFVSRSLEWVEGQAYEPQLGNWFTQVIRSDQRAPGCEKVARTIFRAATDNSARLRYPVHGRFLLLMRSIVPDSLWRSVLASVIKRPRESGSRAATQGQG